jgi:hypothetical protein
MQELKITNSSSSYGVHATTKIMKRKEKQEGEIDTKNFFFVEKKQRRWLHTT